MRVDARTKAFAAGEDLEPNRLVRLDTTAQQVLYCDAGQSPIGVNMAFAASGSQAAIMLLGKEGTITCEASAAVALHGRLAPTADGKCDDSGSPAFGLALQVASADGDLIEVLPLASAPGEAALDSVNTETLAATKTLVIADAKLQFLDPDGARNVDLPAEALSTGLSFVIVNTADAAENITVRDDAAATITVIGQTEVGYYFCNGVVWRGSTGVV